jgi:hypothetical protein
MKEVIQAATVFTFMIFQLITKSICSTIYFYAQHFILTLQKETRANKFH